MYLYILGFSMSFVQTKQNLPMPMWCTTFIKNPKNGVIFRHGTRIGKKIKRLNPGII